MRFHKRAFIIRIIYFIIFILAVILLIFLIRNDWNVGQAVNDMLSLMRLSKPQ